MSRSLFVVSFAVIGWFTMPGMAHAANAITMQNQAVGPTSFTGSGTYTLDPGWTVQSIALKARPTSGGAVLSQSANFQNGNWGPATIAGLTGGLQYDFYVEMIITNGANQQTIQSATTKATPPGGGAG